MKRIATILQLAYFVAARQKAVLLQKICLTARDLFLFIIMFRLAVQKGLVNHIPILFMGKTTLEDIHILVDLVEEEIAIAPKYVPRNFVI